MWQRAKIVMQFGECVFVQGDSEGPLAGNGRLVGIVAKSYLCTQYLSPGVYVKVSAVSSWIHRVLNGAEEGVNFEVQNGAVIPW
jgi:secreted trypsin-like serine protease